MTIESMQVPALSSVVSCMLNSDMTLFCYLILLISSQTHFEKTGNMICIVTTSRSLVYQLTDKWAGMLFVYTQTFVFKILFMFCLIYFLTSVVSDHSLVKVSHHLELCFFFGHEFWFVHVFYKERSRSQVFSRLG